MISESYDDPEEYGGPGESGPGCLSHDRIVEAAIDFVDHNGLSSLTMRRLGKELGVEAMSLYRYVDGREDLLEGMIGYMVAQLHLRPRAASSSPPTAGRSTCSGLPTVSALWLGTTPTSSR